MINTNKIPHTPGVYLMKNERQEIIYIGKAKNLHHRVSSYFTKEHQSVKTKFLVEKIKDIDFITTNNEKEAFILENQLIKQHLPYYNINLKDGKSYTRLAIDYNHRFPRIYVTREQSRKNVRYFGPYPSAYNTRSLSDISEKLFFLRRCKIHISLKNELSVKVKPCMLYHLKKCYGACIFKEEEDQYKLRLKRFISFLNGNFSKIKTQLEKEMKERVELLQFEQAAKNRDLIHSITEIEQEQKIYFPSDKIIDLFGYYGQEGHHTIVILRFHRGQLTNKRVLNTSNNGPIELILEKVFEKIYIQEILEEKVRLEDVIFTEKNSLDLEPDDISIILLPQEIILEDSIAYSTHYVKSLFESFHHDQKVPVVNKNGDILLKSLKKMAFENAQAEWKSFFKVTQIEYALLELKRILHLEKEPYRIETYDISNIGDHFAVGSCVSFYAGLPDKKNYRYFKIKYIKEQNDFAMIQEVLMRRLKSDTPHPDLIVVDGGKGQVSAAKEILSAMKIDIPLIGLAKKEELIILSSQKDPISLSHQHLGLKILIHARDEAHRFANKLRSKLLSKRTTKNQLDSIKGLSIKRKQALIKEFGTFDQLKKHTQEEIKKKVNIPLSVIKEILKYLHS